MSDDNFIDKLDFSNTFNCLHRNFMLERVTEVCPEIYKFCHLTYNQHSTLQFGEFSISSQSGSHQGDPLGGYCSASLFIQPCYPCLSSSQSGSWTTVGFMDDITSGRAKSTVASDVDQFRSEGVKIGLHLNVAKCEVITKVHHKFDLEIQGFVNINPDDACLLSAPLGSGRALDNTLALRCSDLRIAIGRFKSLPSHDAFILLRSSFSAPKVVHTLPCAPCSGYLILYEFDNLLREGISAITNSLLSDLQWLQTSLPIREGGLGIRLASSLALSAFFTSAASTTFLQDRILPSATSFPDHRVILGCASWTQLY